MMKQKLKQKKKLKKLLLLDFDRLNVEDLRATIKEMRIGLKKLFYFHVGLSEAISPVEIFKYVFSKNPDELDTYERSFWWRVLQKVMSEMRKEEELFIIHKGAKYFVLQTQEESNYYKDILRRNIINMNKSMRKADDWVKNKKWRDF